MELTRSRHHHRKRVEVVQLAIRSARGGLLLVTRPEDAETYPGFQCLPRVPENTAALLREAANRPDGTLQEALLDAIRPLVGSPPRQTPPPGSGLATTLGYPPLTPRQTTATVLDVHIPTQPESTTGAWGDPTAVLAEWRAGRVLLDPILLEYLCRDTRATSPPTDAVREDKPGAEALVTCNATGEASPGVPAWRVKPDVLLVPLESLTIPPADRTNTYLLLGRTPLIIDPGTRLTAPRNRLERLIARLCPQERPVSVVLTHHHDDHLGAVAWLRRRRRLEVLAHPATAVRVSRAIRVDRLVHHGDTILAGDRLLNVIHTPGHAPGHVCLFDPADGVLFAGDMVAGIGTVVVDPNDGSLSEYLESLRRLSDLNPSLLLPAHGPPIGAARARLEAYIAHRHARSEEILRMLETRPRTAWAIARQVYRDMPFPIKRVGTRTVLTHLDHLRRRGLVVRAGRRYARTTQED